MIAYISDTAKVVNSQHTENIKIFRNASLIDTICGDGVSIGDEATVERCVLGKSVTINRRSYFNDSHVGDYTYAGINTTMNYTRIGKFCSIARNVDIGGFDHDYHKFTTIPISRFNQMKGGEKYKTSHSEYCEIGNDVWIAAGAQVMHKVKIGDGAVVGGGAVVTKDVPPYAIVVGVPAKIIKYRFEDYIISELLSIQWWNWPEEMLLNHVSWLIETDVNDETIEELKRIQRSFM